MSILIKGMEMPESCYYCPFADGVWQKNKRCLINGKEMPRDGRNVQQNHLTCPLIEIPTHGRLIDADKLLERFNVEQKQKDMHGRGFASCFENCGELCTEWWCAEEIVENAPTVIPADKDGET